MANPTDVPPGPDDLPAPGDVVAGRYRIDALIGQGGMGAVFRATQLGLVRDVALKMVLPERTSPRVLERFEREARVAAAMHHEGAVAVFDFGVDRGRMFLVMELLVGEPLSALLARSGATLSVALAAGILGGVATTLAAGHEAGLVHRDLKPDNIFLLQGEPFAPGPPRTKVVDFGLAFIKDGGELGRLTADNIISGTPEYMSPEQCRGGAVIGAPSDVYALGCVLMEMLTGEPPFAGSQGELLAQQLHAPAPRLSTRRAEMPAELVNLVERMLVKRAELRPTTAAVRDALLVFAQPREAPPANRLARQVAIDVRPAAPVTADVEPGWPVVVRGAVNHDVLVALAVNNVEVEVRDAAGADVTAGVELLLTAPIDEVGRRVRGGAIVVAGADPDDLDRLAALVRAGAAEVVALPVDVDQLVSKVLRAIGKDRRRHPLPAVPAGREK